MGILVAIASSLGAALVVIAVFMVLDRADRDPRTERPDQAAAPPEDPPQP